MVGVHKAKKLNAHRPFLPPMNRWVELPVYSPVPSSIEISHFLQTVTKHFHTIKPFVTKGQDALLDNKSPPPSHKGLPKEEYNRLHPYIRNSSDIPGLAIDLLIAMRSFLFHFMTSSSIFFTLVGFIAHRHPLREWVPSELGFSIFSKHLLRDRL